MQSLIMQKNIRFYIRAVLIVLINIIFGQVAFSQVPLPGDCLGAYTVCSISFNQTASFIGEGNYLGEVNSSCVTSGERNNAWYIINVQTPGLFGFNIIPNCNNDYDWALYNLTNATCADIATDPLLEVGCDFNGSTVPAAITGMNDGPNPQDEPRITVAAGDVYALLVNNFSGLNQCGYQLDLSLSTAGIIDITPPSLLAVTSQVSCGANAVSFSFSEFVKCNTVDVSMFQLFDPSGNSVPISDVTSIACINGGLYDKDFTLLLDQNLTQGGLYEIQLAGLVEDNCGNINLDTQLLAFSFNSVEITSVNQLQAVDCRSNNGRAEVQIQNGTAPISYYWSPSGQTNAIAQNLTFGWHTITVTSGFCFTVDSIFMSDANNFDAVITVTDDTCSFGLGSATVVASGGTPFVERLNRQEYTYFWSAYDQRNDTTFIDSLLTGFYNLTVRDSFGCILSYVVEIPDYRFNLVPDFIFSPDTVPIPGLFPTVSFINQTDNATAFYWDFGSGDYSNLYEPNYVFPGSGTFDVKLIATNAFGCKDSISKPVTIDFVLTFFAPTAFTPNDDLVNDSFNVVVTGIMDSTYLMVIFDQWGNEVFVSNNLNKSWSGKSSNGNMMPAGTYSFRSSFIDQSGKKHVKKGRVLLFG
jgi:gliding motility-associated-like protein